MGFVRLDLWVLGRNGVPGGRVCAHQYCGKADMIERLGVRIAILLSRFRVSISSSSICQRFYSFVGYREDCGGYLFFPKQSNIYSLVLPSPSLALFFVRVFFFSTQFDVLSRTHLPRSLSFLAISNSPIRHTSPCFPPFCFLYPHQIPPSSNGRLSNSFRKPISFLRF